MNRLEKLVYDILKKNPAVKSAVRDVYQRIFDLIPDRRSWSKNPVTVREGYFFGFHDHSPFSADNKKMLANKYLIPLRMPGEGDLLEIGYFTGTNWEHFIPLMKTSAWNWHQGCKLQWRGNSNEFLFNDHQKGKNITRIYDTTSNTSRIIPEAISSVSGDGRYAVGYSFARVERYMPGYGYPRDTDEPELDKPVTSKTGIYSVDLESGEVRNLLNITDMAGTEPDDSMKGAFHFFSHALFSPSGSRFVFLHRWIKGRNVQNRFSRLVSVDVEGNELYIFPTQGMVSHLGWKNDKEVLAYCRVAGRDGYYLFRDRDMLRYRMIGTNVLLSDGHPSFSPDERCIVTDTYPDRTRRMSLFIYDLEQESLEKVGYFLHPRRYQSSDPYKSWRCDLHPRWDQSGKVVSFDSVHSGERALCTMQV